MQAGQAISLVAGADTGAGVGVGETGTEAEWRRVAATEKGRGLAAAETPPDVVLDGIGEDAETEAEKELDDLARGTPQSVHLAVVGLWPGGLRKLQTSQIQLSPAKPESMMGSVLEASGGLMWSVTFDEEVKSPA